MEAESLQAGSEKLHRSGFHLDKGNRRRTRANYPMYVVFCAYDGLYSGKTGYGKSGNNFFRADTIDVVVHTAPCAEHTRSYCPGGKCLCHGEGSVCNRGMSEKNDGTGSHRSSGFWLTRLTTLLSTGFAHDIMLS